MPDHTAFVSAADGGVLSGSHVVWTDQTVPAGDSITLHFTVKIDAGLNPATTLNIVNDGIVVSRSGAPDVTGSPHTTAIAPAYAVSVDPAEQTGGAKAGSSIDYVLHVSNDGYTDSGRNFLSQAPWLGVFPGLAVTLTILGLNALGDALRAALSQYGR